MSLFRPINQSPNYTHGGRTSGEEVVVVDNAAVFASATMDEASVQEETFILPNIEDFFSKKQVDPWHRVSALEHDCILIVEFSELEGPKPALCIPESPGAHFERNDFAVWLMTADYQVSNHRGAPFSIVDDIQMMLSNEEQGVHTYAHHFTLFDIQARGFVRPFCAAYVTPDNEKLSRLFDVLRTEFSSFLRPIKDCNRRQFLKELTEAVEALNVIETQAISSYYELYYDGKLLPKKKSSETSFDEDGPTIIDSQKNIDAATSSISKPDALNLRYRRLQREMQMAQNALDRDVHSRNVTQCANAHSVDMDQWISTLRRGSTVDEPGQQKQQKILKELAALCPCTFEEFQQKIRAAWMKYRRWSPTASWLLAAPRRRGAKINVGSVPVLFLPKISENSDDEEMENNRRTNDAKSTKQAFQFSVTEIDALHNILHLKSDREKDAEQKRLLVSLSSRLRYFLYPLLTGQLLIIYGSEFRQQLATILIQKLKCLIPTVFSSPRCLPWHEGGTIHDAALGEYKIMGARVAKKGSISECLNDRTKRYLALLDLNNDVFQVPEYRGEILNRLCSRASSHNADSTLILAMLSTVSEYASLAYVVYYWPRSLTKNGDASQAKQRDPSTLLRLQIGDMKIVRYLVELLKMQQDEDDDEETYQTQTDRFSDGFLLEYEPGRSVKL